MDSKLHKIVYANDFDYHTADKETLIAMLDHIREEVESSKDGNDFCFFVAELLGANLGPGV
jgi:hypothetical protein